MPAKFRPRPHLIQEGKSDEELFGIFLDLCAQHLATESTQRYRRVILNFQRFLKGHNLRIVDVRSKTADAWLAQWDGKDTAQHQYAIILQRFLGFLGILDPRNGVHVDVPTKRKNRVEVIRRQLISEEDLKAFLQACGSDYRAALLAAIMWESGLRSSEVASLKWKHIKVEAQRIEVPKRKGGMMDSVPYGLYTQTYLRLLNFSGRDPEEPLISCRAYKCRGAPMDRNGVYYLIRDYGEKAGWRPEQCHPHAFRHSCVTNLVRKGMNPAAAMEIMNHSSITTTMLYTHLAEEDVLNEYRRVMRPDWTPPVEEEPAKPESCPKCSMMRLPGYVICPACGFDYREQRLQEIEAGFTTFLEELLISSVPESKQETLRKEFAEVAKRTDDLKAKFKKLAGIVS